MNAKELCVLFVMLLFAVASQSANASTMLLSAPSTSGSYYGMYSDYGIAAEFTLASPYHVSTIDVELRTPSNATITTFDFSLQNSLAGQSTIFANVGITAPLGMGSTQVMNVDQDLRAGTYYLLSIIPGYVGTPATPGDVNGWFVSDGSYINPAGAVADGIWFMGNSNPNFVTGDHAVNGHTYHYTAPVFTVNGNPIAVPVPPSFYLFGTGIIGLALKYKGNGLA